MGVCFNCLVTVDGMPNVRTYVVPVSEGKVIKTGCEPDEWAIDLAIIGAGPAGMAALFRLPILGLNPPWLIRLLPPAVKSTAKFLQILDNYNHPKGRHSQCDCYNCPASTVECRF